MSLPPDRERDRAAEPADPEWGRQTYAYWRSTWTDSERLRSDRELGRAPPAPPRPNRAAIYNPDHPYRPGWQWDEGSRMWVQPRDVELAVPPRGYSPQAHHEYLVERQEARDAVRNVLRTSQEKQAYAERLLSFRENARANLSAVYNRRPEYVGQIHYGWHSNLEDDGVHKTIYVVREHPHLGLYWSKLLNKPIPPAATAAEASAYYDSRSAQELARPSAQSLLAGLPRELREQILKYM